MQFVNCVNGGQSYLSKGKSSRDSRSVRDGHTGVEALLRELLHRLQLVLFGCEYNDQCGADDGEHAAHLPENVQVLLQEDPRDDCRCHDLQRAQRRHHCSRREDVRHEVHYLSHRHCATRLRVLKLILICSSTIYSTRTLWICTSTFCLMIEHIKMYEYGLLTGLSTWTKDPTYGSD